MVILMLMVAVGAVWRLVRLAIRLALLLALLAAVAVYAGRSPRSHSATQPPLPTSARVARVADGDTLTAITARGSVRVRLLGIDAPEASSTRYGYPTCGGRAAALRLRALAPPGTRVRLLTDPASGATAITGCWRTSTGPHGDLGETQLAAGEAIVYGRRFSRLAAYVRAERSARAHDRGAWRACHGNLRLPAR